MVCSSFSSHPVRLLGLVCKVLALSGVNKESESQGIVKVREGTQLQNRGLDLVVGFLNIFNILDYLFLDIRA